MTNAKNPAFDVAATRAAFVPGFAAANRAYIARNEKPKLDKNGMQPDLAKGLQYAQALTDAQLIALHKIGVDWSSVIDGIAKATNVKKSMRVVQFLGFIVTGDRNYLVASAQAALLSFCSLMIGAKNRNAVWFTVCGKGDENTSDALPSIEKARKVQAAFSKVKACSASTQISVSISDGGILNICGIAKNPTTSRDIPELIDSKITKALALLIARTSDSAIELWATK